MNGLRRILFCGLLLAVSLQDAKGQKSMDSLYILPDSASSFSLDELYRVILEFHPVVKQARLLGDAARQELRLARGGFDPTVNLNIDRKEFDDKKYYNRLDGYVAIPTWFPVNPKAGIVRTTGQFLDPSETIPGDHQLYAGLSIPIGRGLFTDERRTAVQKAQLFQTMAQAEQIKVINDILLKAAKDYWEWYQAYYQYRLMNQATSIATALFQRVKLDEKMGEASTIDTVQAKVILQTRLIERQEALLDFQNTGIALSNHLWDQEMNPLDLSMQIVPILTTEDRARLSLQTAQELTDLAMANHPEMVKLRTKLKQLDVEGRLAREYLKPRLDVSYALLSIPNPVEIRPGHDFKFGLDFSIPVFLRKERSKVAINALEIKTTKYEQNLMQREIQNEITSIFNQLTNTSIVIAQVGEMVDLYSRILEAEFTNLENGESDLFKINIQQEKLIQSQVKFLKLDATYQKLKAQLYWTAGVSNLNFD